MASLKRGSYVHMEIASTDPARTRKFFEDVFDWKFQSMPEAEYETYAAAGGPGGGLMRPMEYQPPGILSYLLSASIDEDMARIEQAGGKLLAPKREISGVGWWALFQEPTGITMALFEAKPMERPPARPRPKKRAAKKATKGRKRSSRRRGR